ncbi:MAG: hypothetical protein P1U56_09515 [Saprospiraceae bacterium]|nr:hypothetical protein [Saprospiraceae bacterium]
MNVDFTIAFESHQDNNLCQTIKQICSVESTVSKKVNTCFKTTFWILLLGLLVSTISILFNNNTFFGWPWMSKTSLYDNYFEEYTPSIQSRCNQDALGSDLVSFLTAYRSKDYTTALNIVQPLANGGDIDLLLLAGIGALEIDKFEISTLYFDQIIDLNDYYFTDHAKWYKALLLLKTKKYKEAKNLLTELAVDPSADHHDESVSLLNRL